jgi:hypothetical protein
MGEAAWARGMNPEIPATKIQQNPYTYTEYDAGSAQWKQTRYGVIQDLGGS